jgi:sarcosine oxidase subunit beta
LFDLCFRAIFGRLNRIRSEAMRSARVLVIGAGVIGLSTAYHLALRGATEVLLLEKDACGAGSSSRAAGIITGLLWSETGILARKRSLTRFRELSHELPGYTFRDVGCLNLFDLASWPERQALLPLYDRLRVPYEILDAGQIRQRWPALAPSDNEIGLFDPLGGYSEPDEYLPALADAARQRGVSIHEGVQVTNFIQRNGRIVGVHTTADTIGADAVVCALHAWAPMLLATVGVRLPVKAFVHQRYLTEQLVGPAVLPAVNANTLGGYIRPASRNRLLLGAETPEREEYRVADSDFRMSQLIAPAGLEAGIVRRFSSLTPYLHGLSCVEERVGLIAFSMDGEPILGPVAQAPGLFLGAAFHSGGFAYNPAAGLLLAQMVLEGRTEIDLKAFSVDRFPPAQVDSYLDETVTQAQVFGRRH